MSSKREKLSNDTISDIVEGFVREQNKPIQEIKHEEPLSDQEEKPIQKEEKDYPFPITSNKKEGKSKHFQVLLRPSIYNSIKAIAEEKELSMNELINQILEGFSNYLKGDRK